MAPPRTFGVRAACAARRAPIVANARASFKAPIEHGETIADVKPLLVPLRPPALEVAGCMSRVAPSEHPSEGGADDRTGRRRTLTRVDPHAAGLHHGSRRLPILSRHARSSSQGEARDPVVSASASRAKRKLLPNPVQINEFVKTGTDHSALENLGRLDGLF